LGQRASVSVAGGAPVTSGPAPEVTAAPGGGRVRDSAPSAVAAHPDGSVAYGGSFLRTGLLTVTSVGRAGARGSLTTSATAVRVDALGGWLTAAGVSSSCVAGEDGSTGSTRLTGGRLVASGEETVELPAEPPPGTTHEITGTDSGERFTLVLNDQQVVDGTLVVSAVRVLLHGPSSVGEIVLAQSRCGASATPATAATSVPSSAEPAPTEEPEPDEPAPTSAGAAETAAATPPPPAQTPPQDPTPPPPVAEPQPDPSAALALLAPGLAVEARASSFTAQAQTVSAVAGGAFGYHASVSFFGGAPVVRGPAPAVTLPVTGSSSPITQTVESGEARAGPAVLFLSGPITARTQGTTGAEGSVTSSVSITGATEDPPWPFRYEAIRSTCSASPAGTTGSTTITGGTLATSFDDEGEPAATEAIGTSPAPNTERSGTLDHIGDSFRVVFNEQVRAADGSLTVNAVRLSMLGPTAVGELVIGQSRCGVTLAAAATTSSSSTTTTSSSVPATTSAGGGSSPGAASIAGTAAPAASGTTGPQDATTAVAGTSTSRGSGGEALAFTGGSTPGMVALALLGGALVAARASRCRSPEGDHPSVG
ncbi:MAG: choice-of-anchor P family protein, partial [Acidimicrobiales bacterium]